MIDEISFTPKYKRENGLWVVDPDNVNLPDDFLVKERSIVYIPPGQYGGNHKHPRSEAFFGIGSKGLFLVWLDESGQRREAEMVGENQELTLFVVPPYVPHAVINRDTSFAVLVEYADGPSEGVEPVDVLGISKG